MGISKRQAWAVATVAVALVPATSGAGSAHAVGDLRGPGVTGSSLGAAGGTCNPAQLTVGGGELDGGLSHTGSIVIFTNRGGPCTLRGYPDMVEIDRNGRIVERARRTLGGYLGGAHRVRTVHLATGGSASAVYEGLDAQQYGEPPCPEYTALLVTPPGTTRATRLSRSDALLGVCDLEIHPVVPGRNGQ
ncbi:MAG TPA: DUF4232 domain-containing protein [Sporichthyaceae bacterium]|jgi:hypothetical protein|nr:DUF4232 domain-containing protein [Sporichthyaceae bacterium]